MAATQGRGLHHDRSHPAPRRARVARRPRARGPGAAVALAAAALLAMAAPALAQAPPVPAATASAPTPVSHIDPPGRDALPPSPPASLDDPAPWLEYRLRGHIAALPHEARLFYRRGLALHQAGARDEAVRLVRSASELDPAFVGPRLTLASWFLLREPSQALLQYAAVLELARQNFVLQQALAANAAVTGLQVLFLALLAAAFLLLLLHQHELRHAWRERLALWLGPGSARAWAWALLVLPFAAGLGVALPVVVLLGLLWPALRARERAVWLALVALVGAAPVTLSALDRLAAPLREDAPPFHGVPMIENEPYSRASDQRLARLASEHPDDPFLQFGAAWMARRGGDLTVAEAGYRRAAELWPQDARSRNNLGNTLVMQGRSDEALAAYVEATRLDPGDAAAWFNASQIHTQRFQYREATEALARASALNFDLVKSYQSQATDDGQLPLVDQWIAPSTFWRAVSAPPARSGPPVVPPAWRGLVETSGWRYSILALVLALAALVLGIVLDHGLPQRTCNNCGAVVCRRCAQRRREQALCPRCAAVEARAESPDFARVLLLQHRRRVLASRQLVRTALATLVPGLGLLMHRRLVRPLVLLGIAAALTTHALGLVAPFSGEPRLALPEPGLPLAVLVGLWVAVYVVSIGSHFGLVARAHAQEAALSTPVRSRSVQSTRHAAAA